MNVLSLKLKIITERTVIHKEKEVLAQSNNNPGGLICKSLQQNHKVFPLTF